MRAFRVTTMALVTLTLTTTAGGLVPVPAVAGAFMPVRAAARTVLFDGREIVVPTGWPVFRLAEHPRMCVRLDRRAVYLGTPSQSQN